jgi:hypothetical protein
VACERTGTIEVGDDTNLATVVGQSLVEDGGGPVLEHRAVDLAADQQTLGNGAVGGVGIVDAAPAEEQAVAAGQAHRVAGQLQQPGGQPGHAAAVATAGNADDGDATDGRLGVGGGVFLRKQVLDDGVTHRPRVADGRLQMRQQARAGIDLDDGAALRRQRPPDVLGHHVDAGNVQPHRAHRQFDHPRHLGVDLVGAVDGDIAVALDQHAAAGGRHRLGRQTLALEVGADHAVVLRAQARQRVVFGVAAARVGVDLGVDQRDHVVHAVADDGNRLAARRRLDAARHHQQPMFMSRHEALDEHLAAMAVGHRPGGLDLFARAQVQRHAAAVVAVGRFHDHRQSDVLGRGPGLGRAGGTLALGHRHADLGQQALGQVLVAGDAFGDGAGAVGLGGPDPMLAAAVAELHQVAAVQTQMRDAALGGAGHDVCGARAEVGVVDGLAHGFNGAIDSGRAVVHQVHQQPVSVGQCGARHDLVAGAEDHAVDAALRGAARLAETGGHAGQVEQLDDQVFEHMAEPGAFAQPLAETPGLADAAMVLRQGRQRRTQAVDKTGQLVRGPVLQRAEVEPDLQG